MLVTLHFLQFLSVSGCDKCLENANVEFENNLMKYVWVVKEGL